MTASSDDSESMKKSKYALNIIRKIIVKVKIMAFLRDEDGLTIVEYAVAAGMITALVVASFTALGVTVDGIIATLNVDLGG